MKNSANLKDYDYFYAEIDYIILKHHETDLSDIESMYSASFRLLPFFKELSSDNQNRWQQIPCSGNCFCRFLKSDLSGNLIGSVTGINGHLGAMPFMRNRYTVIDLLYRSGIMAEAEKNIFLSKKIVEIFGGIKKMPTFAIPNETNRLRIKFPNSSVG